MTTSTLSVVSVTASHIPSSVSQSGLSTAGKVGLGLGLGVPVAVVFFLVLLQYRYNLRKQVEGKNVAEAWSFPIEKQEKPEGKDPSLFINSNRSAGSIPVSHHWLADLMRRHEKGEIDDFLHQPAHIERFLIFLGIFGTQGVLLRELMMLASIRYLTQSKGSWLDLYPSEIESVLDQASENDNFLRSFTFACSFQGLSRIRSKLQGNGMIEVIRSSETYDDENWTTSCEAWTTGPKAPNPDTFSDEYFVRDILHIFTVQPDGQTECVINRRNQIYHPFARKACQYIMRNIFMPSYPVWSATNKLCLYFSLELLLLEARSESDSTMDDVEGLLYRAKDLIEHETMLNIMYGWVKLRRIVFNSPEQVKFPEFEKELLAMKRDSKPNRDHPDQIASLFNVMIAGLIEQARILGKPPIVESQRWFQLDNLSRRL